MRMLPLLLLLLSLLCSRASALPESVEGTIDEEQLKLRVIEGPGVILHKTSGPLEPVGRPLGGDFPGTVPVRFIRQAYGIDAPHSKGGRKILNQTGVCTATSDVGSEHDGGDPDYDMLFGTALLARAREMFLDRGLEHELEAFLATRVSNPDAGNRRMHWVGIDILPNQSLALHSHPNMEFAYIVEGVMHEWRLVDYTLVEKKKVYVPEEVTVNGAVRLKYHGPDMTPLDGGKNGTFQHNLYREGEMFINTIGDVHQSFTKDEGVKLFVMWGDGNADVHEDEYPKNARFLNKQSAKAWE